MTDIYCHIHTPVNIKEKNKSFIEPIIFDDTLYVIKEKRLQDILFQIDYYKEYIQVIRENGYKSVSKWLNKKNLINECFLEEVSQYWIKGISLKQVSNYTYFQKNDENKPVISDKYLKGIFKNMVTYNHIKRYKNEFNEKVDKYLNLIEDELLHIENDKSRNTRRRYYQSKIFKIILDNFIVESIPYINEKIQEVNNVYFSSESLLSHEDLFIYKTSNINGYKNFNFKLTGISHKECLKENTFIKLYASLNGNSYSNDDLKYTLEEMREYSQIFTRDTVDFGVDYLKRFIGSGSSSYNSSCKKKNEIIKDERRASDRRSNERRARESSNLALIEKTQTLIQETEDHIISRYNALKNYTNIYFAPEQEMIMLLSLLNMNSENSKRINNLIFKKRSKIETDLVKFVFKNGNLPYSSCGFASLNF